MDDWYIIQNARWWAIHGFLLSLSNIDCLNSTRAIASRELPRIVTGIAAWRSWTCQSDINHDSDGGLTLRSCSSDRLNPLRYSKSLKASRSISVNSSTWIIVKIEPCIGNQHTVVNFLASRELQKSFSREGRWNPGLASHIVDQSVDSRLQRGDYLNCRWSLRKKDEDSKIDGRENSLTTPITPTFLSLQSATDSSQHFVSFPVSHCALWITFPAKVSRPSILGQSQRLRAPTPVNKTSAVSWNSSQSS